MMACVGNTPPTGVNRVSRVASALRRRARVAAASTLGRIWLATLALKVLVATLGPNTPGWIRTGDSAATIVVVMGLGYLLFRRLASLQRRLLWRVRRKLVLSYLLIGFVPLLLLGSFFVLSGTLLLLTVSSSLVQTGLDAMVDDATGVAAAAAADLGALSDLSEADAVLARRLQVEGARYPGASIALVADAAVGPAGATSAAAGPWGHAPVPRVSPAWVEGRAGGMLMTTAGGEQTIVARAAQRVRVDATDVLVVVDLPLSEAVVARVQADSGTVLIDIGSGSAAAAGEVASTASSQLATPSVQLSPPAGPLETAGGLPWVSFVDLLDWPSGEHHRGTLSFQVRPSVLYGLLVQGGEFNLAGVLVVSLVLIGVMFLTIEVVALVMGFALAKSITGAVHELFTGTERVRRGDLSHRIHVETQDQLGELASSFNAMTGSIGGLLQQAEEKRRLEEELRIARDIQMSLLPGGPVSMPGLELTAVCRPAREMGGDYYDFVRLSDRRLGVLVADVSGKGTSAALYMAELKGLILALSQIYQSPKRLLMEVNRILATSLDSRTFIAMTYAVVDLDACTLTYARAGHTPLFYLAASEGADAPRTQILVPDGLVVGLHLEGIEARFAESLEECTLPIHPGDLFVLFTDGITEAMNEEYDLFGEDRFSRLLEDHAALGLQELRARILGDVEAFVGDADPHDDMTLVLLRIDDVPEAHEPLSGSHERH
ncbi:MAG: SpoIIE family protein phosphatase [Acidobacteria bacterium]|nr:SpoIIE family protein phosphatase [Acidobacteriota bacterium]